MNVPVDNELIPRKYESGNTNLNSLIDTLQLSRKITEENVKIAQEKYKEQYDKKSKENK